jgi:manganese transport protein
MAAGEASGGREPGGRARLSLLGGAALVSVGYVDPGNWATDLEGGSRFGYQLLWVLVGSGLIATLLQTLSLRLGVVTGLDLASACRQYFPPSLLLPLWALAELAIVACDLAEVLGSAVALNLLFGLPLLAGALITVCDVFLILVLQRRGVTGIEVLVALLVTVIALCLGLQVVLSRPEWGAVASGLWPRLDSASLYIAVGMLGATVMPHNLYLQSALVPRGTCNSTTEEKRLLRSGFWSTAFALSLALLLNAAILIVAAAAFHTRRLEVPDLQTAHQLLTPVVGTSLAAVLFAVALLCSGQSSSITGTLAGQVVMSGFLRLRLSPVWRRLLTRGTALVPALVVLAVAGEQGTMPLLLASQVLLSLQLPFAVVPLVRLTGSAPIMGAHVSPTPLRVLATLCALAVVAANCALVWSILRQLRERWPVGAALGVLLGLATVGLLAWTTFVPLRTAWASKARARPPLAAPISSTR